MPTKKAYKKWLRFCYDMIYHDNILVNKSCLFQALKQEVNHKIDTLCVEVGVLELG